MPGNEPEPEGDIKEGGEIPNGDGTPVAHGELVPGVGIGDPVRAVGFEAGSEPAISVEPVPAFVTEAQLSSVTVTVDGAVGGAEFATDGDKVAGAGALVTVITDGDRPEAEAPADGDDALVVATLGMPADCLPGLAVTVTTDGAESVADAAGDEAQAVSIAVKDSSGLVASELGGL